MAAKGGPRLLRFATRAGVSRGFLGNSRGWTVVATLALAVRVAKRLFGGVPQTAYSETLRPGDCVVITNDREARVVRAPS